MKEAIQQVMDRVAAGEISALEGTKAVMKVIPRPSDMYNQANDSHYPAFQKFLDDHAEKALKK